MAISSRIYMPWEDGRYVPSLPLAASLPLEDVPYALVTVLFLAMAVSILHQSTSKARAKDNSHRFPLLNPKAPWELTSQRARQEYHSNALAMTRDGIKKFAAKPFRILTIDYGEVLVLPTRYANEIKNDARLSFTKLQAKRLHSHLPGFHIWEMLGQENKILQHIVQNHLTQALPKITGPLSKECGSILAERLSSDSDWHTVPVKKILVEMVARLSTLAFLGPDLSRNPEWIDLTTSYAVLVVSAAASLNAYPSFLRRLANSILPECRALRETERRAQGFVAAQLAERRRINKNGQSPEFNDVLEWFEVQYKKHGGAYDPTSAQLALSVVAIHTTTDLVSEAILDLAQHQDLIEPLRQEILSALSGGQGLTKSAIHSMKLLDSVVKETQRMKPVQVIPMERRVMEDVTLSDDIRLKRDSVTLIMSRQRDPDVYENPDEYDGYRFYRRRQQPGKENTSQLVTTSPDYLAFGHGMAACPGRFFAAQEIKIILCHLLLKYDWHLPEGGETFERITIGNLPNVNPMVEISIRRRDVGEAETVVW